MKGLQIMTLACLVPVMLAPLFGQGRVMLGVSYPAWRGEYKDAPAHLQQIKDKGFRLVALIPQYAYVGRNRIDFSSGPTWEELEAAVAASLEKGFSVILKPHLEPLIYRPGFDPFTSENASWRVMCPWRGFFDVEPTCEDYRDSLIGKSLRMLKNVLEEHWTPMPGEDTSLPPLRLELGAELMNSVVSYPNEWEKLLAYAREEIVRLGLKGKVVLSHNFSHHIEMPDDVVLRMKGPERRSLARYIKGLDCIALSQYMDLSTGLPDSLRGRREPTPQEVALALALHEKNFRDTVLQGYLRLRPREIPPLHIGEFGVGRGGLRHPNLWAGAATPEEKRKIMHEVATGLEGLVQYLREAHEARSAVLWVTGGFYDIFGWMDPIWLNTGAADAIQRALSRTER